MFAPSSASWLPDLTTMASETETSRLVKPNRARSPYWEHFGFEVDEKGQKLNPKKVMCNICWQNVNYCQNTTNLRQHLESKHSEVLPGPSRAQHESESGSIVPVTVQLPSDSQRSTDITKAISTFIAKDMRPVAIVEGKGMS